MAKELTGKVIKLGKIKDYGHETNWGKEWVSVPRFFMQIQTDTETVNVMVDCKAGQTQYGFRIPKEEARQRPFMGDIVKITTHTIRKGNDGASWASVTWSQTLEIVKENPEARAELEAFKQQKKQEREDAFKQKLADEKQKKVEAKEARLKELEQQRNDPRLPEGLGAEISQSFDIGTILVILRDTRWLRPIGEGDGGLRCLHYPPDGCGYPGTGMRRPGGALYGLPQAVRTSILNKALKAKIIEEKDGKYSATELGRELLAKLDTCPDCKELRKPYNTISHYTMPGSWSSTNDAGIRFHCECEIKKIYDSQKGCNSGVTFTPAFKKKKESEK